MEEVTNMQLMEKATESVLDNEATILPTSAFVKGERDDEIFQKQTLKEEESSIKATESKLEQATKAVEAIDPPEIMGDCGGDNEVQTDHRPEAPTLQSEITIHSDLEGFMTKESSTKSSYDIEESGKIPDSHTIENSENKDGGKSLLEETVYIEEPTDVELQKSETESAPEDKTTSALLTTVCHTEETLEESTQEKIHKEVKSTVAATKEELASENNSKKMKNEDLDLHKVTGENDKKEESQPEPQSLETIIIKHQNLGVSAEIKPSNDNEVLKMAPASFTEEKLVINVDGKLVLEKAKEINEATDMQLTESANESVSDNGAQSALPKSTTVIGEKVDEILQEQTLKKEEFAAIDNSDSCTPENQLTQTDKFVEQIGLSETIGKVAAVNKEQADNQSESQALESVIKSDTLSEGLVTMKSQSNTMSSYDVEELKNIPESHFLENSENRDIENSALEEAIYIKEATNVQLPNSDRESDKASSPLPITEVVGVATTEEICKEEIQMKAESAATDTKEEQRPDIDFDKKKEVPEAINLSAAVGNIIAETKSEVLNQETIVINHKNLGENRETNTCNSTEELEIIGRSHTGVKTETEDGRKFIEGQTKDMEEATITQLLKTATESVPGDEAPSTLLSSAIIRGETAQEIFNKQTVKEEESTVIETREGCKAENEQEQMATCDELNQVVNLPIALDKVNTENEEHCDHQSEVTTWESVITKHTISEGKAAKEISTNSSYDVEQHENISEHNAENLDINDSNKIPPDEAIYVKEATEMDLRNSEVESVPEDKAGSILPCTASVEVETVEEHVQEEILNEGELTVRDAKDIKEGVRPENYFENKNDLEAFELQETNTENEKKDDPQLEVQTLQTKDIKHRNLEGETAETKPCNVSETTEEVSASPTRDKLDMKEGGNHTQEEAKVMKEATDMQLLETATESFDDEGPSILPTLSIVKGETVEETFLLQTLKDEEPVATDNTGLCTPENNLEQTAKVVEDFDTHETMGKVGAKNEEHPHEESQPSESDNPITKSTYSEGMMTTKDITKTSNQVEEQEMIPRSYSLENSEIKDSSSTLPEQTISMKEAAVDSSKFETESLPENKALSTLPTAESIGVETVMQSIQEEIHKEGESTVTKTKEGQKPEDDLEEKKEVPKTFELHEAQGNIPQSEAPSLQTVAIKHPDLVDATETNTCSDYEENEQLPASHTSEKLEIKDGGKFILEGGKEKEEAIEMQLQESTKKMTGYDEAPRTFPTAATAKSEVVDETFLEQTFTEEEPSAIDKDGSSGECEETAKLVEAIDLTETEDKVGAENEEQAEGTVTMGGSTTRYEVEQENIPDSHSLDNLENKDGVNKEATFVELPKSETESLHEDQAMSTLSTTTSVGIETIEESIQEEHREEESEVTETRVGQRPESDFEEEKKVPENLDLHKTDNTCVGTQMKYEVQSLENTATEHPDSEADTREITTNNDKQQSEVVLALHASEKLEINDKGEYILEEEKWLDEGIEVQLKEYAKESVPDDEASSTLPTSAMLKDETADETIQELTFKKEDSEVVDTNGSFRQENEHDETDKEVEELDIPKTMGKVSEGEEKEQYADYQSEFPILENPITQHTNSDEIVRVEGNTKTRYDVDEQEKIPKSHSAEKSDVKDSGKNLPEEALYIKEATYVELPKSQTESVPEDKALSTLLTTTSFSIETVEESNQEGIQKEEESAGTEPEEMQRPENDFDEKKKVPEAFDMHKETVNTCVETKKEDEPKLEAQSLETIAAEHQDLEGDTNEANLNNDGEEYVQVPASHTAEEQEFKDTEKFILEKSKEMEVSTGMQLHESTKESVLVNEASLTLPTSAVAKGEIVEEIIQQQTLREEESAAKGIDERSRTENELEQPAKVYEGNDLPETMGKVQSKTPTSEITIMRDTISEGLVTTEISKESIYDGEYLGNIPYSLKNSEMKDSGKIVLEEATDVDLQKPETEIMSEDKAMSILPSTASTGVDIVEENIQEEIHEEAGTAATDTEAGHSPENYLVDKEEDFEAFDLHKSTAENEPHLEVQSQETMVIVHPNLGGENRETEQVYDRDELKQVPQSLTEEKSEIKNEWRFVQEEAKAIKEATAILLDSTKESVTDDEAPSTLPASLAIVKAGVVKEIFQEETFKEEESATIGYDWSYMPENELEQTTTDVEASDLPKFMGKVGAQNEEYTTKHTKLEGLETKEISTESNYDGGKMEKILESHPVDNSQIKDDKATCINKATYVELKSETENVPEEKTLSTFLTTASVEVKASEESIQAEIHKQMESAVPEIDSDKRTKILEVSHLHDATLENKKIDELHSEEHSQETIVIENPKLEGDITETNPHKDTEEPEQFPTSNTEEKLVMKDGEKIIHVEAKVIKETNVMQLPESAEESIPDDKGSSTLPSSAIVKGVKVDDIIQEQTLKEEKSAVIDNDESCRPENEVEQTAKFIEIQSINQPEIMGKVGDENKERADYQSEVCTLETSIKEHMISEGLEITEIMTESSYDVEQHENIPESDTVDNSKILDGQKTMAEEAIYIKEAINLESQNKEIRTETEDNALPAFPTIETVGVETTQESIQDEMHKDAKPAVTTTEEGQTRENDFDKKKVQEVDLQEETPENERMHEHQSEVQSLETRTVLEHPILVGDTAKTDKINDTEELEQVPTSHNEKKFDIKDGEKFIEEKAIDMEEAINVQLPESVSKESVADDESLSTLAKYEIVKSETVDESVQEQTFMKETLAAIDNKGSCRPENVLEQKVKVVEAFDLHKATAENEKRDRPQFEVQGLETVLIKHATLEGDTTETKPSGDTEEQEQGPVSYTAEKSETQDVGKSVLEEEKVMDEANDIQLEESAKESIPGKEAPSMLPKPATVKAERLEEIFKAKTIEDEESATIDDGSRPENELEQTPKIVEAIALPETKDKVSVETEEHAKNKTKSMTMESTIRSGTTSAELVKMASSTESSYDVDALEKIPESSEGLVETASSNETSYEVGAIEKIPESSERLVKMASSSESRYEVDAPEKIPESQSVENSEIKDCKETSAKETTDVQLSKCETESVPEDKSVSTLPTTALVGAETFWESTQENIHMEDKSGLTHTREWQKPNNGVKEKKNFPKAFDQHQDTSNASAENEKKDEPQSEVQTAQTTVTKFDGETTNKNTNTEELEMVPTSLSRVEIEIKDGGKFMQEEEKEMEEATCAQLPISAKPSLPNEEALSTSAIVKGESEIVEEIVQEQILKEEEAAATDNNGSCRPKNKLEQTERVVEEIALPGTMGKLTAENEKQTNHQSEPPTLRNVITTHTNSEGMVKIDSTAKSCYNVKQQEKNLEAHTIDNSENKDAGKTSPEEEAIYIKKATNVELAKLETKSVPEENSLSTLLTTETVRVEIVEESTQINIHKVTESAVADTNEEHRPEKDFEEKKVLQVFDVHSVTINTSAQNKKKDEPLSEVQSLETIGVKHPNIEGKTIETNPNNYTKELETVPSSSSREILDMKDEGKSIQEEARLIKEATGVPEALPTLPRSAIVKGETVDEIFEDHTLKEEKAAAIDNKKGCRPENQIEQTAEVVEAIDLIETMGKVGAQNKEHAYFQSEALKLKNVVSKHTISEGMLTTESSTKSSYDVEKLEKVPQSHTLELSEIKDDVKHPHEEAKYVKEATNVELHEPEAESVTKDKALSTTNSISITVEECIKQEIHKEAKSAMTYDKEGKRQENIFEEKEKVPEAFNLQEETDNTSVEHEKNAETQSEEHSVETMLIKLPNFDPAEKISITKPPYRSKKEESYPDYEVHNLIKEKLPETKEMSCNIQDQISESDDHIQGQIPQCEDQIKPEPQMEAEQHLNVPPSAKEISVVGITKEVHDGVDRASAIENIEDEHTIDSRNSLAEAQISPTTEETLNQVKGEIIKNFKATDPDDDEQKAKTDLSIENSPTQKEAAAYRDRDEVIESPKEEEVGDEFEKISPSSSGGTVMIKASRDIDEKAAPHKKSHGILSGVGSKVKHSISKVKKAITGKSSHPKTQSPK